MRRTIGLLINNFDNEYQRAVLAGVQSVCQRRDVNLLCLSGGLRNNSDWEDHQRNSLFRLLLPSSFDGLLMVSGLISGHLGMDGLVRAVRSVIGPMPLVNLGRSFAGVTSLNSEGADSVRALVDHLVTCHGRRRFVYMGGWDLNPDQEERKQALLEALARHGLTPVDGGLLCGYFVYEHARTAISSWLDAGGQADAVVAANDMMAFACYDELTARGIEVPSQVSLTGFDDFPSAEVFDVPLTTVNQGTEALAAAATEELLDQLAGHVPSPDRIVPSNPVFRQSCGCLSAETRFVVEEQGPFRVPDGLQENMTVLFDRVVNGTLEPDGFLRALGACLRYTPLRKTVGDDWDHWTSSLLHRSGEGYPARIAQLLHQARILIRETSECRQASSRLRASYRARTAQVAASTVSHSFDRKDFVHNLASQLPGLGLSACLVALFEESDPQHRARLIFRLADGVPVELPEGGLLFSTADLVPPSARTDRFSYIVETLHDEGRLFGMVLFQFRPDVEVLSDAIGFQIRSALRAVLLVEELEEANRTIRANQEQLILSEKMAVLGGLVAGIAHEVNTPLGVSFTAVSAFDEKLTELQARIDEGADPRVLKEVIGGLKAFSRFGLDNLQKVGDLVSGFKQIAVDLRGDEERVFDLGNYLSEAVQSLAAEFRDGDHQVRVVCPPGLALRSYPGVFLQIVTHLTTNAVIHGFQDNRRGNIVISAQMTPSGTLELGFADDGRGLDAAGLSHLFEPFYSGLRHRKGSGLGTYIVYNLVTQKLRGTIRVSSVPGQGLVYRMEIPVNAGTSSH